MAPQPRTAVVLGRAGHAVLRRHAEPVRHAARCLPQQRTVHAQSWRATPPASRRLDEACHDAAASWAQAWRVLLKAEGLAAGEPPRCVGTALAAPAPQRRSADLYGARGHGANDTQAVQGARQSARPAAPPCLAHALRLLLSWAASGLHHALRPHTLQHPALAHAHPSPFLRPRCNVATHVHQDTDRIRLHVPSACPVQALLYRVTALLALVPLPAGHPSSHRAPAGCPVRCPLPCPRTRRHPWPQRGEDSGVEAPV
jgi:hypothetical protein